MKETPSFNPEEDPEQSQYSALDRELDNYMKLRVALEQDPENRELQQQIQDTEARLAEFSGSPKPEAVEQLTKHLLQKERGIESYAEAIYDQLEKWQTYHVMLDLRITEGVGAGKYPPGVGKKLQALFDQKIDWDMKLEDFYEHALKGTKSQSLPTRLDDKQTFVESVMGLSEDKIVSLLMLCMLELDSFQGDLQKYNEITGEHITTEDLIPETQE